jgi:hypothetical protein
MENVNQQLSLSFPQQDLYRCLQDCLGLQKSWIGAVPYVALALKDVQEASVQFSDIKPSSANDEYHLKVYKDAMDAIEKAVKRTEESYKGVQSAVQSIIRAVANGMKKDVTILLECPRKLNKLSFFTEKYCWYDASCLALTELLSQPYVFQLARQPKPFFWPSSRYAESSSVCIRYGPLSSLKKELAEEKDRMDRLMDCWMRDMRKIWGIEEEITDPTSIVLDPTWVKIAEEVAETVKVIVAAEREMMVKPPYNTEVYFAMSCCPTMNNLEKVLFHVVRAKCTFEELEKRIGQIVKDVSTLAETLGALSLRAMSLLVRT